MFSFPEDVVATVEVVLPLEVGVTSELLKRNLPSKVVLSVVKLRLTSSPFSSFAVILNGIYSSVYPDADVLLAINLTSGALTSKFSSFTVSELFIHRISRGEWGHRADL